MSTRHTLIAPALAAVLGGLIVPALAEKPGGPQMMPGREMGMGRTGNGMMSRGMMSGNDLGGCMSMMQSTDGEDGRPNSQWQKHRPAERSMEN
jgi:hypothetical protein